MTDPTEPGRHVTDDHDNQEAAARSSALHRYW